MPELRLDNFTPGMKRDRSLREAGMLSLRTLKNMEIIYTDGRLRMRKGYTRWNTGQIAAPATQLFWYQPIDTSEDGNLFGIYNGYWYQISETSAHKQLSSVAATARRPIIQFGNRVFFGTDEGWRWTDSDLLIGSTYSYDAGLSKPTSAPTITLRAAIGHWSSVHNKMDTSSLLNATTTRKLAMAFTVPADTEWTFSHIRVLMYLVADATVVGTMWAEIRENDGGEPEADAVSNGTSFNVAVSSVDTSAEWIDFVLTDVVTLTAGQYWIVIDTDDDYRDNFYDVSNYVAIRGDALNGHPVLETNSLRLIAGVPNVWTGTTMEFNFQIGGIFSEDTGTQWFDYVYTYVDTTYDIESRPSENTRIETESYKRATQLDGYTTPPATERVDKIRLYRRKVDNFDTEETSITDTYKFVGEQDYPYASAPHLTDAVLTDFLGADLQTTDHYKYSDTDDSGDKIRTAALLPHVAVIWKNRVWFAEANSNILYFSKKLEQDGATNLANTAVPDYFPLENKLEMPVPTGITALATLGSDLLVVYFADESIYTIRGGDGSLNPPPDINMQEVVAEHGIIAPAAVGSMKGRLYYLSRDGFYEFTGSPLAPGDIVSEDNQSIFDAIETTYLDDSILAVFGNELWLLVDADNDGALETILIQDMQRYIPMRGLYDRPWRMYEYDTTLNDIIVRKTGATTRTLLAADAESNYILELEDGLTDNGKAIVGIAETHDLIVRNQVHLNEVEIDANFSTNVAPFLVTVIDNAGVEYNFSISPGNIYDPRSYRTGCRVTSLNRIRMKLQHRAVAADELLALSVKYT